MVNTQSAVDWAIGRGANGVEIDLTFDPPTGDLVRIHHGFPCDCTCKCPPPLFDICGLENNVCAPLFYDVKGDPCEAATPVGDLLRHLASKKEIALTYFDSKIKDMDTLAKQKAGINAVKAANEYLFGENYGGNLIIGIAQFSAQTYLEAVINEANKSPYKHRIFFTIEGEENNITGVLKTLHKLPTTNIVYGTGYSSCVPIVQIQDSTLELAAINKARNVTGMSYMWTVDKISRMEHYINYLQGIMTNYPGVLYDILTENGIEMATQSSTIPVATNSDVITDTTGFTCDCKYHYRGCIISHVAPKAMACKCIEKTEQTCEGVVVQCYDVLDQHCQNPDGSVSSCLQGGGDCNGYETDTCECKHTSDGCSVSQPPPSNSACKCVYNGVTCTGEITRCKDRTSQFCKAPDSSIHTCVLGGGNCAGYPNTCDCGYALDGCFISKSPPRNIACKCIHELPGTCTGTIVQCLNTSSKYCISPDTTYNSCFQGDGNCEGYKSASCDCTYEEGGCVISHAPPPNAACHCKNEGFTCRGGITRCRDPDNTYCTNPDSSKNTCLLGGGNCGGYH